MTYIASSLNSAPLPHKACRKRSTMRGVDTSPRAFFIQRSVENSLDGKGKACGHPQTSAMPSRTIPALDYVETCIDALTKLAACLAIGLVLSVTALAVKNGALHVQQAQHEHW